MGCGEYLYIEKELIPTVWMVKMILVITMMSGFSPASFSNP